MINNELTFALIGAIATLITIILEQWAERRRERKRLQRPKDQLQVVDILIDIYDDVTDMGHDLKKIRRLIEEKTNE